MGNNIPPAVFRSHYARMAAMHRANAVKAQEASRYRIASLDIAAAEHAEARIAQLEA